MRHVVYLLVIANLAYLGWNLFQVRTVSDLEHVRELPPLPATASRLVTLQEMQQQQEEQQQAPEEQEAQLAPELLQEQEAQQEPEMVQQQEVQREPEILDQQEVLQEDVDVATVETLTQQEPPGAGMSLLCQALGPFMATEQLEEVAGKLAGLGLETSRRSIDTQLENGWWVYLPAMPRDEAKKIARLLDENDDKEYYIGKNNFISLGTFRVRSRADRRLKTAARLGLEPVLEARYKTQTAHWLDLRIAGATAGDLAWITEDYPELQLEEQACY